MLSVLLDRDLKYPEIPDGFSPDERYPEYHFATISPCRNDAYRAVRQCFAQAGLHSERFGTPEWNPLGELVRPGSRVFVLCNFVQHRRQNESTKNFLAKCTHGSIIRAVIDYLLLAVGETGQVMFGNAPLQSANWQAVLDDTGAQSVWEFYRSVGARVEAKDLRLLIAERRHIGSVKSWEERDETAAVTVDLGKTSLLSSLENGAQTRFRVSDYDPDRTERFHSHGSHYYVISRDVLESDVIFSLPKLKTHQKVGLTCGLKGFVGAVAHKDCLAHHRFGSPRVGGDEYPADDFGVLQLVSGFHDSVQRSSPTAFSGGLLRAIDRLARHTVNQLAPATAGSWFGNDTAWRMALDISRILIYGAIDGTLRNQPQRQNLILVDGLIGGEGEGPLSPKAVKAGALLFCDDVALCDWAAARLIGFDPEKLPLLREAFGNSAYPISTIDPLRQDVFFNGDKERLLAILAAHENRFKPPQGWLGHIEFYESSVQGRNPDE